LPNKPIDNPTTPVTRVIDVEDVAMIRVLGVHDRVLGQVEKECPDVSIHARGNQISVSGDTADVDEAIDLLDELINLARHGVEVGAGEVSQAARIRAESEEPASEVLAHPIISRNGRTIRPKTLGQKKYVDSIDRNTIVFGIGPAGTGKTYLAMAKAVEALDSNQVDRIILTRPAVEAGERLGFLPGTLAEKIDPYLRPLFDALHEMMNPDVIPKLMAAGTVEVAPLAYMRGRTLNNSFIVLDEAQNTTPEQMKMFLTRLGFGSKMVITGDVTQVDVPGGQSGLARVVDILEGVQDIHFERLSAQDIVRHKLVSAIVDAYARYDHKARTKK
jgi:phosphate starvation-inducible protein PhoH and related proteins